MPTIGAVTQYSSVLPTTRLSLIIGVMAFDIILITPECSRPPTRAKSAT